MKHALCVQYIFPICTKMNKRNQIVAPRVHFVMLYDYSKICVGWVSVVRIATRYGLKGREWNPCGGSKVFSSRPDRPWGPCSLLYNGNRVSFLGIRRLGRGVDHLHPSSAEVKETVELYLYCPSEPSWPDPGRTLPFFTQFAMTSRPTVSHLTVLSPFRRAVGLSLWNCDLLRMT